MFLSGLLQTTCVQLAWYKHALYDLPYKEIKAYLSYALSAAIEYFYGDYREHYQKYLHETGLLT